MNKVFLIIGSNEGDRSQNLFKARELILKKIGKPVGISHIYETEPWGYISSKTFYNQCIILNSSLDAETILQEILKIEKELGRTRKGGSYIDRIIDIDILFFNNDCIHSDNLSIPHPGIHERRFVLEPLAEIVPEFLHPVFHKSISQLLDNCQDKLKVWKLDYK